MNDKELLKLTIKQWEYVLEIMKAGITYNIIKAKSIAIDRMGKTIYLPTNNPTNFCFLCHYHYAFSRTYACNECPMEGYWPIKRKGLFFIRKKTTKYCFEVNSVYSEMEMDISEKNIKRANQILKAMKKRLKMLE